MPSRSVGWDSSDFSIDLIAGMVSDDLHQLRGLESPSRMLRNIASPTAVEMKLPTRVMWSLEGVIALFGDVDEPDMLTREAWMQRSPDVER